ncbi:MAG: hypothetical protein HY996_06210 [Micrococcales bacterium]|nr:hypothetical protein [Micrococcales bacterium]
MSETRGTGRRGAGTRGAASTGGARRWISTAPVFHTALLGGGIVAATVAIVGGGIGVLVDGQRGLLGALVGAGLAGVFLGITAASMLFAARVARGDLTSPVYFGIVIAVWFVKLVLFTVVAVLLRGANGLNPYVFFFCVIAAVIGSLLVDCVAVARSRVPYVSDIELPGPAGPLGRPADDRGADGASIP